MPHLRKLREKLIAHPLCGRSGKHNPRLPLQPLELIVELIVLEIRHDLVSVLIIGL